MARNENKKRGEEPEPSKWSNEITGIILLAVGVLLTLALVSYSPSGLPQFGFLEPFSNKTGPREGNLIGPVGAILAFVQILLFGATAWLIPVTLVWFGVVKLLRDGRLWPRKVLGFLILLVAGAVWLHAADFFFKDWAARCRIISPGGVVGYGVGGYVFERLIGRIGTLLLFGTGYLVALILFTGQPPIQFVRACYRLGRLRYHAFLERREAEGLASARQSELDAERERQREQRRREREAAKAASSSAQAAAAADDDGQAELGLRETPVPKIIDASQRRLVDVPAGAKPFERKKAGHQSLTPTGYEDYETPGFDLLDKIEVDDAPEAANRDELFSNQQIIIETLKAFGIDVTPGDITRGPTITRYEIYPSTGLRVSRISQLEADIARATKAERINILAPIPGKDTVGIEIANSKKVAVPLRELIDDPEFKSAKKKIPLALGKDVYGKTVIADLAAMPHLLVAGATGSGKSVCINSIIASMLFKFGPDELRFIMVDPKVVEMQMYNKLPHLVVPVVTDPKKVVAALKWVVNEMEKRYRVFAKVGVRNFDAYNQRVRPEKTAAPEPEPESEEEEEVDMDAIESIASALESGELGPEADEDELIPEEDEMPDRYPYIVVLIDELADLMQTAPADVEMCIARIAQKARAAGIHLIIATQTPRADVVTGIIKANIPSRIAFQVSSALDSRVILDTKGADKLVGKGDMLYLPPGSAKLERAQGAFVSDQEVERLVDHCAAQASPNFATDIQASIDSGGDSDEEEISDADEELIIKCIEVARQEQKCSTSLLQRRLRLGYTRAARMVDILEARGVVGPGDGAKPREVYLK
ncbi:DNA translocase FtsK [Luteolibacter ambystomatis]|uniref:DNA translocase FtsK n=1 Tax=Luteolibacter ambystomatis TaxID=2824561 RepID=A0A975J2F7_9BACT|nr:DNA translocase FtsK [Luteolibacter ambystomatis]QUE52786.1 DNA translocase FtsK [Luteolibacter ambystomatis]